MRKITVYLAHPIAGSSRTCREHTRRMKVLLKRGGYVVYDPEDLPHEPDSMEVVRRNKEAILMSDVILALVTFKSHGVGGEIVWAATNGKEVIAYTTDEYSSVSAWVRFHARVWGGPMEGVVRSLHELRGLRDQSIRVSTPNEQNRTRKDRDVSRRNRKSSR